jgi:AraC-like DNA-binding protein
MKFNRIRSNGFEPVVYNVSDYPVKIYEISMSEFPGSRTVEHWHDEMEITLVSEGSMVYSVNGVRTPLSPGEGIFVNSRQIHGTFSPAGTDCRYICLQIHPSLLGVGSTALEALSRAITEDPALPFIVLRSREPRQKEILDNCRSMQDILTGEAPDLFAAQARLCRIASLLMNDRMPAASGGAVLDSHIVSLRLMMRYIQEHLQDKISVDDIARAGNVSQRTCHNLFRIHAGHTPSEYIAACRLSKAAEYLKNTKMSVTEIASLTGFNAATYFAECFRRQFDMSPSDYRK